jgi:uncharacterized protein YbjT (DUF2867 family)
MILVTGATGNVGRALVETLDAGGHRVRALARTPDQAALPASVDVVGADLTAPETVRGALAGVDKLFLLGAFPTTGDVLERARQAGVEHVVLLTSRCVVGGSPENAVTRMWLDAEAAVEGSGLPWTILHPSGFHANALRWVPQMQEGDTVRAPWPDVPIASIDPADIAAVAATALVDGGFEGAALELSGPEPLTPGQQVATLAEVLRRPLRYEPLTDDEARRAMAADTPPDFVDAFFRFFSDGEFDDSPVVDTVLRITGARPGTFGQWVEEHAGQFR